MTADLSRRRSRVRAPSSPPFLFNVFPAFSIACHDMPRCGLRRQATSTDTKCPQYSGRTVAATVALEGRRQRESLGRRKEPRRISGILSSIGIGQ